jgi:hypothetical protein
MFLQEIFEAAPYTISRTGLAGEHMRIGVWFNAKSGVMLDAHRKNHAELVATEPQKFCITRIEMAAVRKHEDFELDWNEPVIKLANAHGWVRVKAEGRASNLELDLQSSVPADVLKAARHFANELSPTVIFIDHEIRDYNNVWHTRLEGRDIERYLKTGRLPAN